MKKESDKGLDMPNVYGRDEWVDHLNDQSFYFNSPDDEKEEE